MCDRSGLLTAALAGIMLFGATMASSAAAQTVPSEINLPAPAFALDSSQTALLAAPPTPLAPPAQPKLAESLLPMYAAYGAMQVFDVHSTVRGLNRGAREVNPLLGAVGGSRLAMMIPVKAASFAATIYLAKRLEKKNRTAAVILMASLNAAYAVIIAHNHGVAPR